MRRLSAARNALVCALLAVPYAWMLCAPLQWFRAERKKLSEEVGRHALLVLALALPSVLAVQTLKAWPMRRVLGTMWSEWAADIGALTAWAALQGTWQVARAERFGLHVTWPSMEHVAITFGLAAMINMQLLLLPVMRGGTLSDVLGIPTELLVRWHRHACSAHVSITSSAIAVHTRACFPARPRARVSCLGAHMPARTYAHALARAQVPWSDDGGDGCGACGPLRRLLDRSWRAHRQHALLARHRGHRQVHDGMPRYAAAGSARRAMACAGMRRDVTVCSVMQQSYIMHWHAAARIGDGMQRCAAVHHIEPR